MIGTPSSVTHALPILQPEEELLIVIPNTFTDANDWVSGQTGFGQGGAGDRQVEGSPSLPTVYHVETRLPHEKPALLLDNGSVGNLVGDDWVRQQAAAALRAGLRPEQRRRERPLTVRGVGKGGEHARIIAYSLLPC